MWATRLSTVAWVYSKTQTLLAALRIQNQPREESCVSLEAEHVSPLVVCATSSSQLDVQEQTVVSDRSTESETISLDAGLRLDGLPALDLWDVVIEVEWSTKHNVQPKHTSIQETVATLDSKTKAPKVKRRQKVGQLNDVDYVRTNTHSSHNESQLYIFEVTEAVIKMINKGRSSDDETRVQNPQSCA